MFGGSPSDTASINHGTYFYHAAKEGLIANGSSIHAGIRTTLSGPSDYDNDGDCGFTLVEARAIDKIGTAGIIAAIRETVGNTPCYLSIDIDVLDPSAAPATGVRPLSLSPRPTRHSLSQLTSHSLHLTNWLTFFFSFFRTDS